MATKDRTSLKNDFANGKYATGEKFADLIDSMKVVQLPVVDPQALGTSLSFIDSISQDADGKITATKKTLDLANAHELNPFKGWYKTGDTLPTDGFDGAYLYFKDTSELTGQTTIYRWNGTAYADTGTVVDTSNVQTFGSGQAVNATKIKDESGEEVTGDADVLSAEAGAYLSEEIEDINSQLKTDGVPSDINYTGSIRGLYVKNTNEIASASNSYGIYYYEIDGDGKLTLNCTVQNPVSYNIFAIGKISDVSQLVANGAYTELLYEGIGSQSTESVSKIISVKAGDIIAVSLNFNNSRVAAQFAGSENVFEQIEYRLSQQESAVATMNEQVSELDGETANDIQYRPTANLHNSLPASTGDTEPSDGSDWHGHAISVGGSTYSSANYNLTAYINIDYTQSYRSNKPIRRVVAFNETGSVVSYINEDTPAGTDIDFSQVTGGNTIVKIRFMYDNRPNFGGNIPSDVKFGKSSDDIDVDYGANPFDKFGNRLITSKDIKNQKVITSVASSGFANSSGGQYCLTSQQKTTYDVVGSLTVTKVLQVLLGYDVANVCAYSGYQASAIFFKNGSAGYIFKNAFTLKADGTNTAYSWTTDTIAAQCTANLDILETSDIGTFEGLVNGYLVEVNAVNGTIKSLTQLPFDIVIPAGSMIVREPYASSSNSDNTVTIGLRGSTGLILQVGANDEGATPEEIFNYCELAIKESGCKWFIVLRQNTQGSLNYETSETTGSSDLNKAAKLLRAKYGSRFIDHMAYMTSLQALIDQGITPTTDATYTYNGTNNNDIANYTMSEHLTDIPSDMECIATREVPSSLWYGAWRIVDEVPKNKGHFNAQGLECLGKYLFKMIKKLHLE